MAKPDPDNETDEELDWPDGFHWTTGATHWQSGDWTP